jgi:site-specific DNA recombinase
MSTGQPIPLGPAAMRRMQMPLAFLSPRIVDAIANGNAPADLTVTSLTSTLPHNWAEQENKLGLV